MRICRSPSHSRCLMVSPSHRGRNSGYRSTSATRSNIWRGLKGTRWVVLKLGMAGRNTSICPYAIEKLSHLAIAPKRDGRQMPSVLGQHGHNLGTALGVEIPDEAQEFAIEFLRAPGRQIGAHAPVGRRHAPHRPRQTNEPWIVEPQHGIRPRQPQIERGAIVAVHDPGLALDELGYLGAPLGA